MRSRTKDLVHFRAFDSPGHKSSLFWRPVSGAANNGPASLVLSLPYFKSVRLLITFSLRERFLGNARAGRNQGCLFPALEIYGIFLRFSARTLQLTIKS
jgi:hypothetical protein